MVLCWTAGTPAVEKSGWPPLHKLAGCLCSCVTVYLTVSVPRAALQMDTSAVAMLVSGGYGFLLDACDDPALLGKHYMWNMYDSGDKYCQSVISLLPKINS